MGNKRNIEGMARFGITSNQVLGVSVTTLRKYARSIPKDHALAQKLWNTGILEARMLACFIDKPELVTKRQMDAWARDFDNWAICDTCCLSLFDKTPHAFEKAHSWSKQKREFVKRAGFALMACLAWHDTRSPNERFREFFVPIRREATDERNTVRKAVNWALRQIGKRNETMLRQAIAQATMILTIDSPSARWIASDALRELSRLLKKEASTEVDAFQSAKPFGFCRKTSRPIYRMA